MKKLLKIIGYFLLALLALIAAAAIGVKIYLTPTRVKTLVEKQITSQLHRQVKMGGLSISLFTGLTVKDFALSEDPDFSKGTFISSKEFGIRPQLLPLLSKKFFIDQITLVQPEVTIVRAANGTLNIPQTGGSTPRENTNKTKPISPMAFLVSKAVITNGHVAFIDKSTATQSADISKLNLSVRNISLVSPVDAKTDFHLKVKGIEADIDFDGTVNPLKASAKMKRLGLKSGTSSLSASGEVKNLTGAEPSVDVKLTIDKLERSLLASLGVLPSGFRLADPLTGDITLKGDMKRLDTAFKMNLGALTLNGNGVIKNPSDPKRQFDMKLQTNQCPAKSLVDLLPPGSFPAELKMSGAQQISADVNGTADAGKLTVILEATPLDIAYATYLKKPAGIPMTLSISGNYSLPLAMDLKDIQFKLSQTLLTGKGSYKTGKTDSVYAFDLKSNSFLLEDLSPLIPPMQEYGFTGKGLLTTKIASAKQGPDVKGNLQLQNGKMAYSGVTISNIISSIDFTAADTSGKLTAAQVQHEHMSAQNLVLQWNLKDVADMAKINGSATLKTDKGSFRNIRQMMPDSKWAKLLLTPISLLQKLDKVSHGALGLPSFDNVRFNTINGDYAFKSGWVDIRNFDLKGTDLSASMKGRAGLIGAQPLDLKAQIKADAGLVGKTLGDLLGSDGQTTINMTIKGSVDEPDVSLDKTESSKQLLDGVKKQLGDKPAEQVEKLLKGLFKK